MKTGERWLQTAMTHRNHFVQILAIPPYMEDSSIKGAENLVFPEDF